MAPPLDLPPPDAAAVIDAAGKAWLEGFVEHMTSLPPEDVAALDRLNSAARVYNGDIEREVADWEGGRHPLQRPRE